MTLSSSTASLGALLGDAGLGDAALSKMQLTADTLGPAIAAGLGDVDIDDINASEVLLVTLLIDDSGSIRFAGNSQVVRDGHNLIVESLKGAKQAGAVLISCRYLNDSPGTTYGVLYPYRPLDGAEELTSANYNPNGGTPLYDQTAVVLTGVAAKAAEMEQAGIAVRAITAIVTDGDDVHSRQHVSASIQPMVTDLLRSESHIIIGMGIDDGETDFRAVFKSMGLVDDWILTPGNTESELRQAFAVVSQSAVRASQAAGGSFSEVALGGFGS